MGKTGKLLALLASAAGFALMMLWVVLAAFWQVGTDDGLYFRCQMKADVLPEAGISREDLTQLDEKLAAYLSGYAPALQLGAETPYECGVFVDVFGQRQAAFNQREMRHLADCQALFQRLKGALGHWAFLLSPLLAFGGAWLRRKGRRFAAPAWMASALLLSLLTAFALWAAVDFGSAFTFFHHCLFSNDLWLLDPRTDLLIRICPESMFMEMGARIGLMGLGGLIGLPLAATLISLYMRRSGAKGRKP